MEELSSLKSMIRELSIGQRQSRIVGVSASTKPPADVFQAFVVRGIEPSRLQEIREALERAKGIKTVRAEVIDDEIVVTLNSPAWLPQRLTHKIVQETVAKVRKDAVAYAVADCGLVWRTPARSAGMSEHRRMACTSIETAYDQPEP